MRTPEFVLATLNEAAPSLAKLRAALASEPPEKLETAPTVLDFVRQHPGALLHKIAEATRLSTSDAEAELRALARAGAVHAGAAQDGMTRWWPVEAPP